MAFKIDDVVWVEFRGKLIQGTLQQRVDYNGYPPAWWVKFIYNGDSDVYEEDSLYKWNPSPKGICDCGSNKLGHPGHSFWCSVLTVTK